MWRRADETHTHAIFTKSGSGFPFLLAAVADEFPSCSHRLRAPSSRSLSLSLVQCVFDVILCVSVLSELFLL